MTNNNLKKRHVPEVFSKGLACNTTLHFQDGESNRRHFQVFLDDGEMSWS